MNTYKNNASSLTWLMALILAALVAGCGGGDGVADSTAPTMSYSVPAEGDIDVATNRKITATFSEDMASASINQTTFTVVNATLGGTAVTGTVTYATDAKTATFTPTTPALLPASTLFTAKITTTATDLAGNALALTQWDFTTGTTADTTAPSISSTIPANNDTNVTLNANIAATFDEAMDPLTISTTTFTLMQGITNIPGEVTYVGTNAIFNPTDNLTASTPYTAQVTTGVKDLAGLAMGVDKTWSFTTGTAVAAGPAPVVLGTADNFAVLAKTSVSTIPPSQVTGNVGVSPAARGYLTGWSETAAIDDTFATSTQVVSPFKLYAADYLGSTSENLRVAVLNMQSAYTDAAGRTASSAATTNVGGGTLTSLTLVPGVYEWGSAITIPTDLTLSGSATDVWIFKVSGTLDMAANKNVILSGGALPKNIFWQVTETVTMGAGTHFEGIVLGKTLIRFGNLSTINGRLLAQTAVTLDATTVTQPAP